MPVGGRMLASYYIFFLKMLCVTTILTRYQLQFLASYSVKGKLDLHIASGFVFWTDNSTSTSYRGIFRTKTDGGGFGSVINSGVGRRGIQGFAVDWIAGLTSEA